MPKLRHLGKFGRPTYDQAKKIVARFGGETYLAKLIGVSRITIYRWQYQRPRGTDGLIPARNIARIRAAARTDGVLLRPEDWVPTAVIYDEYTCQPTSEIKRFVKKHPEHIPKTRRRKRKVLADLLA